MIVQRRLSLCLPSRTSGLGSTARAAVSGRSAPAGPAAAAAAGSTPAITAAATAHSRRAAVSRRVATASGASRPKKQDNSRRARPRKQTQAHACAACPLPAQPRRAPASGGHAPTREPPAGPHAPGPAGAARAPTAPICGEAATEKCRPLGKRSPAIPSVGGCPCDRTDGPLRMQRGWARGSGGNRVLRLCAASTAAGGSTETARRAVGPRLRPPESRELSG